MLLTSKYIIPVTSPYIEDGGVVVHGNEIVEVGPAAYLRKHYPDEEVKDYGLAAIMPGFVDLHTHLGYTALRGMFNDLPYAEWKRELLRREPFFTSEDWVNSARLGALEAIASGITTIADITASGCSLVAARESGLRARIYNEVMTIRRERVEDAMQEGVDTLTQWRKDTLSTRVEFGIAPGPLYMCHPELFRQVSLYAQETGTPVALHLAGSHEEAEFVRYGSSPFSVHASSEIGKAAGFEYAPWLPAGTTSTRFVFNWQLFDAPDVLAINCVHVDDEDVRILKERDIAVAYCPRANARLGMGTAPIVDLLNAGLRVGLGTDSPAAVGTTDMIDEMNIGLVLSRSLSNDRRKFISANKMLRMATIDAAAALRMDDRIGSLEKGKRADIIAVDLHNSHQNPTTNPASAVIYTANQDNVLMTMVDGQLLYDNFIHVSGLDRDAIVASAQELRERVREEATNDEMRAYLLEKMSSDRRERYSR